jgi:antitoxin YefM
MKSATVTAFRMNMKALLDEVENDQDILILSGPRKKDFVVLSLQQFNAMQETAHLLSTPANANHLMESIAQHKAGKVITKILSISDEEPKRIRKAYQAQRKKANARKSK